MPPTVPQLIAALESRRTLPSAEVARLRQLYEAAPGEFGLRVMLKWLVNRGRLTADQAQEIQLSPSGANVHALLDKVLGASGELQLASDDHLLVAEPVVDREDDTKDLLPPDDAEPINLSLPPRGAPPFSVESKPAAPPPPKAPPRTAEPLLTPAGKAAGASQVGAYSSMLSELFAAETEFAPARSPLDSHSKKSANRKRSRPGWDSPLMLVGGVLLLSLVLGGAFLLWRIGRHSGDEAFAVAEDAYGEGSYAQAVELYDQFLTDYPHHISADRAAVHRGLARLRISVEGTNDWSQAHRTAIEVLDAIAPNEDFGTAHADLGVLLPEIAQNLARQSLAKNDEGLAAEAREVQTLIAKYLPPSDVLQAKTTAVETLLSQSQQRLGRERRIADVIASMTSAAKQGDFKTALEKHAVFASADAAGAQAPTLREAFAEVARKAVGAVRFVAAPAGPANERPAVDLRFTPLINGGGETVEALRRSTVFVVTGGTAFALDGAAGDVVWRHTVGYDSLLPPQRIGGDAGAETLLHDSTCDEFLVVDSWSGVVNRRFAAPRGDANRSERRWAALHGGKLYLTLSSGRLYIYELAGGTSPGYAEFPQRLQQAAVPDGQGRVVYQAAEGGVVYALSARDLSGLESSAIGGGELSVAPFFINRYLLLFERRGDSGRMLVCTTDRDGVNLKPSASHDFTNYVPLRPTSLQRFAAVVDLAGSLKVFDFTGSSAEGVLTPVAEYRCRGGNMLRPLTAQGMQLWAAGLQLERLELQPTLGKLSLLRSYFPGAATVQPPLLVGEHGVAVFRENERRGLVVAAFAKAEGRDLWRRRIGLPVVAPPLVMKEKFVAFGFDDATLSVFDVAAKEATSSDGPSTEVTIRTVSDVRRVLGRPLQLTDDSWGLAAEMKLPIPAPPPPVVGPKSDPSYGYNLICDKVGADVSLGLSHSPPAGELNSFQGGVVLPQSIGTVRWLGVTAGSPQTAPFQPPATAGDRIAWTRPEIVGDSVVISDRINRLYRLELQRAPKPGLVMKAECEPARPIAGNIAAVEGGVFAVDEDHRLTAYSLPQLGRLLTWDLEGPAAWNGPVAAGKFVFVAAAEESQLVLRAYDGRAQMLWRRELPSDALPPVVDGDKLFVVGAAGRVMRLDAADGRELTSVETGLAIVQPPVAAAGELLLISAAGELVRLPQP